jgi:hypothetical protein
MTDTQSILSDSSLIKIKNHLEKVGYAAVLHWHLGGARHPTPLAFYAFDDFLDYVHKSAKPGDAIDVWPFPTEYDTRIAQGKIPDSSGIVFKGGAY